MESLPKDAQIFDVFATRPDVYEPFVQMVERVTRGDSPLSQGERELIGAYVSSLNQCQLCVDIHESAARAHDIEHDAVREKLAPILALARKLTEAPHRVVAADVRAILDAGFTEAAVHDAVLITCIAGFMNRFVFGLGIEGDDAYRQAAGLEVEGEGYSSRFRRRLAKDDDDALE